MKNARIIARLDIKNDYVVKGVHLEGLRRIGEPHQMARSYYSAGADEIVLNDVVASLYGRNSLLDVIRDVTRDVFVPITLIGGIRSPGDVEAALRAGADKVGINTAALARPDLIDEASKQFGSQCIVLSIEAKRQPGGKWEALTDSGRERSGREVVAWAKEAIERGAGEILLTSIDQDGTGAGVAIDLTRAVAAISTVPVIASGGIKTVDQVEHCFVEGEVDAVAIASALHYRWLSLQDVRRHLLRHNSFEVREVLVS
ncbi:imidazole glycerol phosphate synthase subunit HisF [Dongia rigui]|uniref:Imidazole glycerol phosphate synthase subunit HisF n=1 Tax=Dongia rigui TaxID=940149 RepID=A0ABU5E395_9PROT|nr:imidazole glycerol phosphate synthase cyclase subunit [Dongia rigui]MDY0873650.1 imidazole glycerol phosphate synthase cyclase subunit [Dongia rigui]